MPVCLSHNHQELLVELSLPTNAVGPKKENKRVEDSESSKLTLVWLLMICTPTSLTPMWHGMFPDCWNSQDRYMFNHHHHHHQQQHYHQHFKLMRMIRNPKSDFILRPGKTIPYPPKEILNTTFKSDGGQLTYHDAHKGESKYITFTCMSEWVLKPVAIRNINTSPLPVCQSEF